MDKLGVINPRGVTEMEAVTYSLREAVRAIVFDGDGYMALLHVSRDAYYKLPGGGVESGEDFETALRRECLEEIGCEIAHISPIGYTEEYWQEDREKQLSYCYRAELVGEKGIENLTESELVRGFKTKWLPVSEAIDCLENCAPTHWEGDYIPIRELTFGEAHFLTERFQ